MLSTLLSALDGLQDKKSQKFILTLAATNTPWNLDQAVLSRFPRRINVSLPDHQACQEIIKIHMKDLDLFVLLYVFFKKEFNKEVSYKVRAKGLRMVFRCKQLSDFLIIDLGLPYGKGKCLKVMIPERIL
jgi:SpoVK/Ycf46/Vps4 family AAA+-type ATPase